MHPYLYTLHFSSGPQRKSSRSRFKIRSFTGFLGRLRRSVVRRRRRRETIAALSALDDRLLRDIGINRGDIHNIVDRLVDGDLGMRPTSSKAKR